MERGRGGSQQEAAGVQQKVAEISSTDQEPLQGAVRMCKLLLPEDIVEWERGRGETLRGPTGSLNFNCGQDRVALSKSERSHINISAVSLALQLCVNHRNTTWTV